MVGVDDAFAAAAEAARRVTAGSGDAWMGPESVDTGGGHACTAAVGAAATCSDADATVFAAAGVDTAKKAAMSLPRSVGSACDRRV